MSDSLLQQLWEAYAAHEGRKHKRATRGLVAPTDLDRFRTDFNRIIKSVKAEAWEEGHEAAAMRVPEGVWHDTASPRTPNPYRKDESDE